MAVEPTTELIKAGPGSGKTTYLARIVAEAIETGGLAPARVLWLALDRAAQQRQRDYFAQRSVSAGRTVIPVVETYEDLAQRILQENVGHPGRGVIGPLPERLLVGEVIRETTSGARYYQAEQVRRSPRFRDDVADFIAELKRCKIDTKTFREKVIPGLSHAPALGDLADIYERYQEWLRQAQVYDLRGIVWLALLALTDQGLAARWHQRYDLIIADDLQDATCLQIELLAALCGPGTRMAGAYEPAQAIYRFRGAVEDPAVLLESLLPDRELTRTQLSVDQRGRMAPELAHVARQFTQDWALSAPLAEGHSPGQVAVRVYRTFSEELVGVGDEIIELLDEGDCAADEIAVIVRNHRQAEAAREHLALREIPVAGQEVAEGNWAARSLAGDVIDLLVCAQEQDTYPVAVREQETERANLALCRLASLAGADELAIAEVYRHGQRARRSMLLQDVECSVGPLNLWVEVVREAQAIAADKPVDAIRLVLRETGLWGQMAENAPSAVAGLLYLLNSLANTQEALVEVTGKGLSLAQTRGVVEMNAVPPVPGDSRGVRVVIAHDARGLEFDVVYLLGLSEGLFPAPLVVSRLLPQETVRALRERARAHLGIPTATLTFAGFGEAASEALAEEARLFHTAISRARHRLILSCHVEDEGGEVGPSEFLISALPEDFALGLAEEQGRAGFECVFWGLVEQKPGGRASHEGCPVTPCARRPLPAGDTTESEEDRLVCPAISQEPILAELAPDWPLSASSINTYLHCPRRFFFEKLMGLAGEESEAMVYGGVLHAVMAELNQLPGAERTAERAVELLGEKFAQYAQEFQSDYSRRVHYGRARRALEVYAGTEFFREESLASEQWFDIELTDDSGQVHRFRGRIDQVVGVGDAVEVIDYKSGKVEAPAALRRSFCYRETDKAKEPFRKDYQLPIYALAWAMIDGRPVVRVCLQSLKPDISPPCKRSCIELVADDAEPKDENFSAGELQQIAGFLADKAREIKQCPGFEGHPPREGCTPRIGACPYVLICTEADPSG